MDSITPVDTEFTRCLPKIEVSSEPVIVIFLSIMGHHLQVCAQGFQKSNTFSWTKKSPKHSIQVKRKDNTNTLRGVWQLHAHLSGSIIRQCLHQVWQKRKAREPALALADPLTIMPPEKADYDVKT